MILCFRYTPLPSAVAAHQSSNAVAIGVGVGCGLLGMVAITLIVFYWRRMRTNHVEEGQVDLIGHINPWDGQSSPNRVPSSMLSPPAHDDPYSIVPTAWIQQPLLTNSAYLSPPLTPYADGHITPPSRSSGEDRAPSAGHLYEFSPTATDRARLSPQTSSLEKATYTNARPQAPRRASGRSTANEGEMYGLRAQTDTGMPSGHSAVTSDPSAPPMYTSST